jgi:hypothetical protein
LMCQRHSRFIKLHQLLILCEGRFTN